MNNKKSMNFYMRLIHRYLGFFLAGIMLVYSVSGIVLIFRKTTLLKQEKAIEKKIATNLKVKELGKALRLKNLKIEKEEGAILYFKNGVYNKETGTANYTVMELPFVLKKLTNLHKATTKDPLYWLNIFFGLSLFFFVISSFWMFLPKTSIFKKGLYFAFAGIIFALILVFI